MEHGSDFIGHVRSWGQTVLNGIEQVQATIEHEKNLLQLHLETHPLPFQPSPVLVHLIKNNRRHGKSGPIGASTNQRKQQMKGVDYLDRKFESEIRQHYELQNAENCGRWKLFHSHSGEARRELSARLERDYRDFCRQLDISYDESKDLQHQQSENQMSDAVVDSLKENAISIEDTLRLHLAQDWVNQERFNTQEAFTKQTKQLQEDVESYLSEQEAIFIGEREKVINNSTQSESPPQITTQSERQQAKSRFQSNTKRSMLIHTAPPLVVEPTEQAKIVVWQATRSGSRRFRTDVSEQQQKLDELQRRLQTCNDTAEAKRKEGMQWIGRQCAHIFTQLDCKGTEAKVVALLLDEEIAQIAALKNRVADIVNELENHCKQQDQAKDGSLRFSSSRSETKLPCVLKN